MFDKLEDLLLRYQELLHELSEPAVINDPVSYTHLAERYNCIG